MLDMKNLNIRIHSDIIGDVVWGVVECFYFIRIPVMLFGIGVA
jgi:hypothetical protein